MKRSVVIDALPERAAAYRDTHAITVVDVFRATTVIVTALSCGHRVYPVATLAEAINVAGRLKNRVLAGEQNGIKPGGFDINNSPSAVASLDGSDPIVLLTSAGTQLLGYARGATDIYVACLRNFTATTNHLLASARRVALIGAGTRGQARPEDQLVCAWIAERLIAQGFEPENERTVDEVRAWQGAPVLSILASPSVDYLRNTGQTSDIDFVLGHVDDIDAIAVYNGQQVTLLSSAEQEDLGLAAQAN